MDAGLDKTSIVSTLYPTTCLHCRVRIFTNHILVLVSTAGMFAEESTPQEWLKRADDFMRHNLYEVAAKCFRQGKDPFKEKVAMSHHRALGASRIKDNPGKMREEFMLAAQQYLEVGMPTYAAKCLQNARERELLAHLYEKMGQVINPFSVHLIIKVIFYAGITVNHKFSSAKTWQLLIRMIRNLVCSYIMSCIVFLSVCLL